MAGHVRILSLNQALRSERLPAAVRVALARRIVSWTLGPFWAMGLAATGAVALTLGLTQPGRFMAAVFGFPMLAIATYQASRAHWMRAAAWLNLAMFITVSAGVLRNSIHAPIYGLGFLLLALTVPVFGNRWGAAAAAGLVAVGFVRLALESVSLAPAASTPAAATRMCLQVCFMLLTLICLSGINRLLTDALREASREHAEADRARAAGAASDLAFHAVLEQASVGMLLLTPSGTIMELNERAARWLGVGAPQELIGTSLHAVPAWNAEQQRQVGQAVSAAAQGTRSQQELTVSGEHGAQFIYQVSVSPFYRSDGSVGHVIVEVVEVSDVVQTRAQLAQARRLEALGKLSGGVAHDINNMLSAILGAAELVQLARNKNDLSRMDAGMQSIREAVLRASSLTKQLLAFGRQNRFETTVVDVNRLARDSGRLFAHTLDKNVTVIIRESSEPAFVRGDLAALEHTLLNLGLNAQDAMPNGGLLTVEVRIEQLDELDRARLHWQVASATAVVVRVTDTGLGMSAATRDRLFEPFFTTKDVSKGTGLGLAAVHGTVRNHQGAIAVRSSEGQGSSFELFFPSAAAPERVRPTRTQERAPSPRVSARILLADDEDMVREALCRLLSDSGCHVQAVSSGAALLEAIDAGEAPDVIISDLIMPGLNGSNLISSIEARVPGCPLLLLTGYIGNDISSALSDSGQRRLLRKPVMRSELLEAINALLCKAKAPPQAQAAQSA